MMYHNHNTAFVYRENWGKYGQYLGINTTFLNSLKHVMDSIWNEWSRVINMNITPDPPFLNIYQ